MPSYTFKGTPGFFTGQSRINLFFSLDEVLLHSAQLETTLRIFSNCWLLYWVIISSRWERILRPLLRRTKNSFKLSTFPTENMHSARTLHKRLLNRPIFSEKKFIKKAIVIQFGWVANKISKCQRTTSRLLFTSSYILPGRAALLLRSSFSMLCRLIELCGFAGFWALLTATQP
jgi:hypothetical protein